MEDPSALIFHLSWQKTGRDSNTTCTVSNTEMFPVVFMFLLFFYSLIFIVWSRDLVVLGALEGWCLPQLMTQS